MNQEEPGAPLHRGRSVEPETTTSRAESSHDVDEPEETRKPEEPRKPKETMGPKSSPKKRVRLETAASRAATVEATADGSTDSREVLERLIEEISRRRQSLAAHIGGIENLALALRRRSSDLRGPRRQQMARKKLSAEARTGRF